MNARSQAQIKDPIYELPHGIKVIGECYSGLYVRCYIVAHELFPRSKISPQGRQLVQRSRVVMTSILGRPLATNEHVHHVDEDDKKNDSPDNLEVLWSDEHNKHHKLGFKHSKETSEQISISMKKAYKDGRHKIPEGSWLPPGYKHSEEVKENLRLMKLGKSLSDEHKEKLTGSVWITDGVNNRQIKDKDLPEGWRYGITRKSIGGQSASTVL